MRETSGGTAPRQAAALPSHTLPVGAPEETGAFCQACRAEASRLRAVVS